MKVRKISCPEIKDDITYRLYSYKTGDVYECGDMAPLLRKLAEKASQEDYSWGFEVRTDGAVDLVSENANGFTLVTVENGKQYNRVVPTGGKTVIALYVDENDKTWVVLEGDVRWYTEDGGKTWQEA